MTNVNFGSTYRIKVAQAGIQKSDKAELTKLIKAYPNRIMGKGDYFARVSMSQSEDKSFFTKLKDIGYQMFQIFDAHNVNKYELDDYIQTQLDIKNYKEINKTAQTWEDAVEVQKMSSSSIKKRNQEGGAASQMSEYDRIRNGANYQRIKNL